MAQIAGLKAKVAAAEDKKAEIANEAAAKKVARQTTQKSRGDKATAAEAAVPPREAERLPSAAGDSKGRVAQLAAQLQSIPKPAAKKDGPPPTPLPTEAPDYPIDEQWKYERDAFAAQAVQAAALPIEDRKTFYSGRPAIKPTDGCQPPCVPLRIMFATPVSYGEKFEPAGLREADLHRETSKKNGHITCGGKIVEPHLSYALSEAADEDFEVWIFHCMEMDDEHELLPGGRWGKHRKPWHLWVWFCEEIDNVEV